LAGETISFILKLTCVIMLIITAWQFIKKKLVL
jgi:hypothetical protein